MNLSKKWLNDYFHIKVSDKVFADVMTLSGSKVEGIKTEGAGLKNIVVGKIKSIARHPDSDHLWVCSVDIGSDEDIQIVTGAQNLKRDDVVPVALNNSVIFGGKEIKAGMLRGVESEGMLCSLSELGLTLHDFPYAEENGIFVLGDDCCKTLGKNIRDAIGLNDVVTEFEITSNRPDCLSVVGLAREAAASFGLSFESPVTKLPKECTGDVSELLKVDILAPEKCYRYVGAVVKNVRIAPSPLCIRERLRASGVRPINNIVDITNYVMLEYGQPMHAFDIRFLHGGRVIVRNAATGEKITTLDGIERNLDSSMLVIADDEKPVAIAGIMGGEYSGIMEDTTTIVFESACFNGVNIRGTSKTLCMRTESSSRFEKELDPHGCLNSLYRALELIQLLDAGDVVGGIVDCDFSEKNVRTLPFDWEWTNKFIGINVSEQEQKKILENIEFKIKDGIITIPAFRNDVGHLADISEEVARFYGYENIPNHPLTGVANGKLSEKQQLEKLINETMLGCGLSEIQTYSFISPKLYDKICLTSDDGARNCIIISNPLGEETGVMRTTTLPSMLEVLARNFNYRNAEAKLFELATEYIPQGEETLPIERQKIAIGMYGADFDFYSLKGIVEELLYKTGIEKYDIIALTDNPSFHPGRSAKITVKGKEIAVLGEIHPKVTENYGFNIKVFAAIVDFDTISENRNPRKIFKHLPKYPATSRDLAFVCRKDITVVTLEKAIFEAVGELLEDISLFDVYEGSQIPSGMKSVAFNLRLRSSERTLTDDEAEAAMKNAISALEILGISLRS
jgi:phenylalanyl-tRNA synthetase beta chain